MWPTYLAPATGTNCKTKSVGKARIGALLSCSQRDLSSGAGLQTKRAVFGDPPPYLARWRRFTSARRPCFAVREPSRSQIRSPNGFSVAKTFLTCSMAAKKTNSLQTQKLFGNVCSKSVQRFATLNELWPKQTNKPKNQHHWFGACTLAKLRHSARYALNLKF